MRYRLFRQYIGPIFKGLSHSQVPLKVGPTSCPETSVWNYHYSLCNSPEERISHIFRGGCLKSRTIYTFTLRVDKNHHHKHQGLDLLIRSVFRITAARANASSVFQLFSFLVVCIGMISKGFDFVAFFASVKASSVYIHLSCLLCV